MTPGGDFFDFLNFVAKDIPDNRKLGKKVLDVMKDPQASARELFDAFQSGGFNVSKEDCVKLKEIDPELIPDIPPVYGY